MECNLTIYSLILYTLVSTWISATHKKNYIDLHVTKKCIAHTNREINLNPMCGLNLFSMTPIATNIRETKPTQLLCCTQFSATIYTTNTEAPSMTTPRPPPQNKEKQFGGGNTEIGQTQSYINVVSICVTIWKMCIFVPNNRASPAVLVFFPIWHSRLCK